MPSCRRTAIDVTLLHYVKSNFSCYSCGPAILYVLCKSIIFLDDCSLFLLLWRTLLSTDLYDTSTIERLYWSPVVFDCLSILTHEVPEFFNLWSQHSVKDLKNIFLSQFHNFLL